MKTHPLRSPIIVLPFTESFVVMLAWTLLLPLDTFLKQRILNRARRLRSRIRRSPSSASQARWEKRRQRTPRLCALGKDSIATPAYVNSEIALHAGSSKTSMLRS